MRKLNKILLSVLICYSFALPVVNASKRVILTFDDGPHPGNSEKLMDVLEAYDVPATFFLVGMMIDRYPDLVKEIDKRGFDIGNHTFSDIRLINLNPKDIAKSIRSVNEVLYLITGKKVKYFRPPGGRLNQDIIKIARDYGLQTVLWTRHVADTSRGIKSSEIFERATKDPGDLEVIMMHSGPRATLKALPHIIQFYKDNGYSFETLDSNATPVFRSYAYAKDYDFDVNEKMRSLNGQDIAPRTVPAPDPSGLPQPVSLGYLLLFASIGSSFYYVSSRNFRKRNNKISFAVIGADKKVFEILLSEFEKYGVESTFFVNPGELEDVSAIGLKYKASHDYAYRSDKDKPELNAHDWQEKIERKKLNPMPLFYNESGYDKEKIPDILDSGFIPVDWKFSAPEKERAKIIKYVNKKLKPLSVIAISGTSMDTAEALPDILAKIRAKGLKVLPLKDYLVERYN